MMRANQLLNSSCVLLPRAMLHPLQHGSRFPVTCPFSLSMRSIPMPFASFGDAPHHMQDFLTNSQKSSRDIKSDGRTPPKPFLFFSFRIYILYIPSGRQKTHWSRRRLCSQMLLPLHSLHVERIRSCS